MNEQEILTEALAKADVLFGMRKMLQQYGIPCTEPMTVTLNFGEKAVETKKFPGMPNPMPMAISDEDMKTAILDFLNKADVMYGFMGQIFLLAPGRELLPEYTWEDWRIIEEDTLEQDGVIANNNVSITSPTNKTEHPEVKSIQGWMVNEQGQIVLTANPIMVTPHSTANKNPGCS